MVRLISGTEIRRGLKTILEVRRAITVILLFYYYLSLHSTGRSDTQEISLFMKLDGLLQCLTE